MGTEDTRRYVLVHKLVKSMLRGKGACSELEIDRVVDLAFRAIKLIDDRTWEMHGRTSAGRPADASGAGE